MQGHTPSGAQGSASASLTNEQETRNALQPQSWLTKSPAILGFNSRHHTIQYISKTEPPYTISWKKHCQNILPSVKENDNLFANLKLRRIPKLYVRGVKWLGKAQFSLFSFFFTPHLSILLGFFFKAVQTGEIFLEGNLAKHVKIWSVLALCPISVYF